MEGARYIHSLPLDQEISESMNNNEKIEIATTIMENSGIRDDDISSKNLLKCSENCKCFVEDKVSHLIQLIKSKICKSWYCYIACKKSHFIQAIKSYMERSNEEYTESANIWRASKL